MKNSEFLLVTWKEIISALVSGLIMGLIVIGTEMVQAKTIFGLDWMSILSAGVLAFTTFVVSYLKSLLTTQAGKFVGLIKIK